VKPQLTCVTDKRTDRQRDAKLTDQTSPHLIIFMHMTQSKQAKKNVLTHYYSSRGHAQARAQASLITEQNHRSMGSFASAWLELITACDVRGHGLLQTDRRTDITTGLHTVSFTFTGGGYKKAKITPL